MSPAVSLNFELKYFTGLNNISKGNSSEFTLSDNDGVINNLVNKSSVTKTNAYGFEIGLSVYPSHLKRKIKPFDI
jgi:hypothetical protein